MIINHSRKENIIEQINDLNTFKTSLVCSFVLIKSVHFFPQVTMLMVKSNNKHSFLIFVTLTSISFPQALMAQWAICICTGLSESLTYLIWFYEIPIKHKQISCDKFFGKL